MAGTAWDWQRTHARATHTRMEQSRLSVEVCALGEGDVARGWRQTAPPTTNNKKAVPHTPLLPLLTECRMPGDASTMPLLAQLQLAPSIHRPYTMQPSSGATSSSRGLPATYADANSSVLIATLYLRA